MTLKEACKHALAILKQVMEEKLNETNVEVRTHGQGGHGTGKQEFGYHFSRQGNTGDLGTTQNFPNFPKMKYL